MSKEFNIFSMKDNDFYESTEMDGEETKTIKTSKKNISQKYKNFFDQEKYSDITIKLKKINKDIKLHKFIINNKCDLFIEENLKENVVLVDEDADFIHYLRFIYTGSYICD
jgi:hypothetical protein